MTEKIIHIFFLLSIPEAHNSQSAPHVQWNRIQTGQRTDQDDEGDDNLGEEDHFSQTVDHILESEK